MDAVNECSASNDELDLSQPEVLSIATLINIIQNRCPKIGDLSNFDRMMLLDLFYKNVAPQPQRKYRVNRRGRQMTKNQIMHEKRKRKFTSISNSSQDSIGAGQTPGSSASATYQGCTDRLKPAPSAINSERKMIKLGRKSLPEHSTSIFDNPGPSQSTGASASTKTQIKVTNRSKIDISVQSNAQQTCKPEQNGNHGNTDHKMEVYDSEPSKRPTPRIIKIIPEKAQAPASKIKLKRPISTPSDIVSPTHSCMFDGTNNPLIPESMFDGPNVPKAVDSIFDGPHQPASSAEASSPEGLIKDQQLAHMDKASNTTSARSKFGSETPNIQQEQETSNSQHQQPEDETTSPTDEGTMRKKFKRIAVKWP